MDLLETWLFLGILGLTLAIPLGPVSIEIIKETLGGSSAKLGLLFGLFIGFGAMTGDFIVAFSMLTIGGEVIITVISDLFVKFILFSFNVVLLSYLGISALRSPINLDIDMDMKTPEENISNQPKVVNNDNNDSSSYNQVVIKHGLKNYVKGLAIVLTSPWSYVWWVSFGTVILFGDFNAFDPISRLALVLMFISGVLAWVLILPSSLTLSKQIASDKVLKWIANGAAIIMLVYAVNFALEAFDTFTVQIILDKSGHHM